MSLATQIAAETQLPEKGVAAAVELFVRDAQGTQLDATEAFVIHDPLLE